MDDELQGERGWVGGWTDEGSMTGIELRPSLRKRIAPTHPRLALSCLAGCPKGPSRFKALESPDWPPSSQTQPRDLEEPRAFRYKPVPTRDPRSSNGRTTDSESVNCGSNPHRGTTRLSPELPCSKPPPNSAVRRVDSHRRPNREQRKTLPETKSKPGLSLLTLNLEPKDHRLFREAAREIRWWRKRPHRSNRRL